MKIGEAKRVVVKVGTSTLTHKNGKLNLKGMESICRVLTDLKNYGREIVLVSSGAIGVGVGKLGLKERPSETSAKQAAAAVGQCELMFMYDKFFGEYNQCVAQVLLTKSVTDAPRSRENVQNTFNELAKLSVIPIVNENDTVETAELEGANFGDNDMLSAIVAQIISADLLVILTDTEGLYDSDPRTNPEAKIIREVKEVTEELENMATGAGTSRGTGGMATKLKAAKLATESGIACHIMNGSEATRLYDLFDGKEIGTHFIGR